MKKTIIILIGILVGVFVFLSVLDSKSEYKAEKAFWKINQEFKSAASDPGSVPDVTFDKLVKSYEQFLKKYSYSKLVPIAHVFAGRVYMIKRDYVKARGVYEEIAKTYPKNPNIGAQAVLEISQSYYLQQDWANVLSTYHRLLKEYPLTDIGFQVPITITEFYLRRGEQEKSQVALEEAIAHYKNLIEQYKNPGVEFNALRSMAVCYMASKKWQLAVDTLSDILLKFPDQQYLNKPRMATLIKTINTVSLTKLKNYDLPIGIYEQFAKKYPKHPYQKALSSMAHSLKLLKEKNISVTIK